MKEGPFIAKNRINIWILGHGCVLGSLAAALQLTWILYFFDFDPNDIPILSIGSVAYDFFAFAIFSTLILSIQKNLKLGFINLAAAIVTIYAAAFIKFDLMNDAIRFSDILLIPSLFQIMGAKYSIILISPVVVFSAILIVNIKFRWFSCAPMLLSTLLLIYYGYQKSLQFEDYEDREHSYIIAPTVYYGQLPGFINDTLDYFYRLKSLKYFVNDQDNLDDGRFLIDQSLTLSSDRDVHLIVLESFINPHLLAGYEFSRSPLGSKFQTWMNVADSAVLTPVTGARSADSEFEILCGLGALLNWRAVVFNALTVDSVGCLPKHFTNNGWQTMATSPVYPYAFNVKSVYERMGFKNIVLRPDLEMNDLDGAQLSTESLFKQNLERYRQLKKNGGYIFNYVFTMSTHIPFDLDTKKRPIVIETTPDNELLRRYVNALHYTIVALENFIEEVLKSDPNALIIILGDHAPYLGPSMKFSDERQSMGLAKFRTPLVVLNGGMPQPSMGNISMYNIPSAMLDILTSGSYCHLHRCSHRDKILVRPLVRGIYVTDRHASKVHFCKRGGFDTPNCELAKSTLKEHMGRLYDLVR